MRKIVLSVLRIVGGTLLGCSVLIAGLFWFLRQPVFGSVPRVVEQQASAGRLERDVRTLTERFVPRDADHPESLRAAADWIAEELRQAGGEVGIQRYEARGAEYVNVFARFGPETDTRLVVGAHYDAFGQLPGADDNASGTAGLLELARLIGREEPRLAVELVAFSTEEPPFFGSESMGSAVHASSAAKRPIEAMICLEMIGRFTEQQPSAGPLLDLLYPDHGRFIMVAGRWSDRSLAREVKRGLRSGGLDVVSYTGWSTVGIDASDHRNYWAIGVSAVMITDTAYVRNEHYHTLLDTADTLDYERMGAVIDGLANLILAFEPR